MNLDQPVLVARPLVRDTLASLRWDAIEILVHAAAINFIRMATEGQRHSEVAAADPKAGHVVITVIQADVLAFIGNIERLRKLVEHTGGDDAYRLAKKAFLDTANRYEKARHHIEHLDHGLPNLLETSDQALMSLAWVAPTPQGMTLTFSMPGSARVGPAGPAVQIPEPGQSLPFAVRIAGADYDLIAAHQALQKYWERVNAWSAQWAAPEATAP